MISIPGPIPLTIHPFFWVTAFLIGWLNSQTLQGSLIWVGIIFISVLVHELGHALTAICFRQKTRIDLVLMGGLTSFQGPALKFWKQFLITLNGPLFGFGLFILATFLLQYPWSPQMTTVLRWTQLINLFWTFINLLPILPLDGGHLLRISLEAIFGVRGYKASLLIGALFAAAIALYFLMMHQFLIGAIFFLFAYQGFEVWRHELHATRDDRQEETQKLVEEGQKALQEGHIDEAKRCFYSIIEEHKGSLAAQSASEFLSVVLMRENNFPEAYALLLPLKAHLGDDGIAILHQLAMMVKDDKVVCELSARSYQFAPSQMAALGNARSFARMGDAQAAGGWLQTAMQYGGLNFEQLLQEETFARIAQDPEFRKFFDAK